MRGERERPDAAFVGYPVVVFSPDLPEPGGLNALNVRHRVLTGIVPLRGRSLRSKVENDDIGRCGEGRALPCAGAGRSGAEFQTMKGSLG